MCFGYRSDRNTLAKNNNNTRPNIFVNVRVLVCYASIKHSLMHGHGLHNVFLKTVIQFDVHVTVHRVKFFIIKPTRCTNFSNVFLEWNSTCFGQFLCPLSGIFHCTYSSGICRTGYADCLLASSQHSLYDIYHCCRYSGKLLTMDRGTVQNM